MMPNLFDIGSRNPDAIAREQALDVERSWIVEAPAGSGKTGLLIQRYLRLLSHQSVSEPEQVLAITFTKAATEEIRERILRALQRAQEVLEPATDYDRMTHELARSVLLRDAALGWRLLDDPHRLRIRTIDGICADITRSLPILCGGCSSLIPTEDASLLYQEASRQTWLRLGGEDAAVSDALRFVLLHRDGDLQASMKLVAEMLSERQQWGSLIPFREEALGETTLDEYLRKQLDRNLEQVVCEGLGRLTQAFPKMTLRRLASLANSLSSRSGYNNQPSPLAVCRELHTSPTAAAEHLAQWRALINLLILSSGKAWRKGFNKKHLGFETTGDDIAKLKEIVLELQAEPELLTLLAEVVSLPPAKFPSEQWPLTKALVRVLRQALLELQLVFNRTGRCDFTEPALLARYALDQDEAHFSLGSALGTELKHLLVDEMQDTSTKQYELIERLTEGWADEQKTVFLVGDPKQSIYLFRQARVERFAETMRTGRLGDLPVRLLQLTANFRSQAGLVTAFNRDFSKIFPRSTTRTEDISYIQAAPSKKLTPDLDGESGAAWHLTVTPKDSLDAKQSKQRLLLQNARDVRTIIERWRARPLPSERSVPWRIAVLVQSRQNLRKILPELRRDPAIPFRALKIDTLDTRREILDLLALTRALLHPADRTAWLAVLRAPWCGLSLADLHSLAGQDEPEYLGSTMLDLVALRGAEITADGIACLERVWPVLDAAVRAASKMRLPERVERTWRSLGGNVFLDDIAYRNALTFLDLLRTLDREEGQVGLPELMSRLKRLYASADSREDSVDLVTIHGSKGLEWDVVLVPELERPARHHESRLVELEELRNGGTILAPISAKGEDATTLTSWLRGLRSRREAAERKRLFYVACTRAREELHLFGIATTRAKGGIEPASGSLLEAAWPAARDQLMSPAELPIPLPLRAQTVLDLAASGDEEASKTEKLPLIMERLPLSFKPLVTDSPARTSVHLSKGPSRNTGTFRPHGPFGSRCLGTTIHLFLEEAAKRLVQVPSVESLLAELPEWKPRIHAVLRTYGLPPSTIQQQGKTVAQALDGTLSDPVGRWLLEGQEEARNEVALATLQDDMRHYRIDRIFRAGATPREVGDRYLWLIDYKTTNYSGDPKDEPALQQFLSHQQRTYEPQLRQYARLLRGDEIRLGLWFPLLRRLVWWTVSDLTYEVSTDLFPHVDESGHLTIR